MHFVYREQRSWAPLSWVAMLAADSPDVSVQHGPRVERSEAWFGEIVWDAEFAAADFDRTDIVMGSGGRRRDGHVDFVSSGSTVDRLLKSEYAPGKLAVSNSLAALLSVTSSSLRASYPNHIPDILSVQNGLSKTVQEFQTNGAPVNPIYFHNLRWDGHSAQCVDKPFPRRDFSDYNSYLGFLRDCLRQLSDNLRDANRQFPYSLITTISSGYDSTMIAAIARDYGCENALTFSQSREGQRRFG